MNDHERFLLLAARRIDEPLTSAEEAELDAHLTACPTCRAIVTGMRRDDIRLKAALSPVPVSPRVREIVMAEAAGRPRYRVAGRFVLLLAAAIGIAAVGVPLIAGGPGERAPSTAPTPDQARVPTPSPSPIAPSPVISPTLSVSPSTAPSVTASLGVSGSVNGGFTYSEFEPRRGSITARFVDGKPDGAWTRRAPATGPGTVWSGTITCLVIDGNEAWMAGPVTANSGSGTQEAIFILLRDVGPEGAGDRAMMDLSDQGQSLALLEGWCRDKFRPGAPYIVTDGDIRIDSR
jgi:hypothetical protein